MPLKIKPHTGPARTTYLHAPCLHVCTTYTPLVHTRIGRCAVVQARLCLLGPLAADTSRPPKAAQYSRNYTPGAPCCVPLGASGARHGGMGARG